MRSMEGGLRADPEDLEAQLVKARLLRRMKQDSASETILRALAADEQALPQLRAQAWAELAQMLDRQEQYDDAMQAMLKCKELMMPNEAALLKSSEAHQHQLRNLAESMTAAHFQGWQEEVREFPLQRVATLTGFPRSGTTLLEQVLDAHPGLVSSD